jgi:hypothetical protein
MISSPIVRRNIVTAILLYNHGLCCHMHCLSQCRSGSAKQDALHFYHHSYQMVTGECAISAPAVQKYARLLLTAVCHNMALLCQFEYGNTLAAYLLRYQLLQWIHDDFQGEDGAFFHVGICLASFNDFCSAPAA